jgi:hypothetical protein
MELQQHDFSIVHRPGKHNANADALSRIPPKEERECYFADISGPSTFMFSSASPHIIIETETEDSDDEWEEEETAEELIQSVPTPHELDWASEPYAEYPAHTYTNGEIVRIYKESLKEKHVVAGQPLTKGGSRCTFECDTENHHTHNYCTCCKRNLQYKEVLHSCEWGLGLGQRHPEMIPTRLTDEPWWDNDESFAAPNLVNEPWWDLDVTTENCDSNANQVRARFNGTSFEVERPY